MRFELDNALIDEILFCMENQDGDFLLDAQEGEVIDINNNVYDEEPDFNDEERFIPLPEWGPNEGYRLMERFTSSLKNPVVRHELSIALNSKKGVFRIFKNTIEQHPEVEKIWFAYKEKEMKSEVLAWYNALRTEWGLEPIGSEPEDTSSLVLEDFVFREGTEADRPKAQELHKICIGEIEEKEVLTIYELMNPFDLNGDFFIITESADSDFSGFICAAAAPPSYLRIRALEVKPEYRGMGLGKTLLAKLLEKADKQKLTVTIDLPAGTEFFARALHLENFKPCMQTFARKIRGRFTTEEHGV